MIAYRKFSDIQWDEFGTSAAPNPPKAPKVGDEGANDARTLDGLGALAASRPALQNELVIDSVVDERRVGKNPQAGKEGAKAAKAAKAPPKDQISPSLAELSDARQGSADWSTDDWRARFDELRAKAEIGAFNSCIAEWLNRNPSPSLAGCCAWCGKAETPGAMVVPFGAGEHHAWLHTECWPTWHQSRRKEAAIALRRMGIAIRGSLGDHDE
jgi:hypothetical protein